MEEKKNESEEREVDVNPSNVDSESKKEQMDTIVSDHLIPPLVVPEIPIAKMPAEINDSQNVQIDNYSSDSIGSEASRIKPTTYDSKLPLPREQSGSSRRQTLNKQVELFEDDKFGRATSRDSKSRTSRIADGDLLEYRMKRLIFYMGYYPKIGVLLKTSQDESADVITDLDVFGTYIHKDFSSKTVWADCKSGQARPHDRITWIKGVMTSIQANDVIFVKSGVRQTTKQYARRAGIQILDTRIIDKLEHDYGIRSTDWRGSWNYHVQLNKKNIFSRISVPTNEVYKKISTFISSDYWVLDNFSRAKKTITALRDLSSYSTLAFEEEQQKAIRWAVYELICLFTMSILNITKEIYYFSDEEKRETIYEGLISSEIPLKKRTEIVDASFKIAYNLVKQQFPEFNPPANKQSVNLTPPSYFEAFNDLLSRIINSPHDYYDILRFLDFVLSEYDLQGKKVDEKELNQMFTNTRGNTHSAKTILHFIHQVTGMPREIFCLLN
ncbi:hypothetical protein [Paenibacillus cymbidii]|uniref:hypothetical protein n=1 Tax=Paenibacillus cymbidii TaxID=1639034 RepID=UPI0010807414|nr:hypothetical protein [Paenibacillus cymbidii]